MMLVLLLLLVVGGAVAINFQGSIEQARLKGDVRGIETIFKSVDEALVVGFDPYLIFEKKENGLRLIYQEAMGRFKKKIFEFPSIQKVTYKELEPDILFFCSKGTHYPSGTFFFTGKAGTMKLELKPFTEKLNAEESNYPEWIREICKKKEKKPQSKNGDISS